MTRATRALAVLAVALLALLAVPATAQAAGTVQVDVAEVDLNGPAVSPVTVTVSNDGSSTMTGLSVSFRGPVGWTTYPQSQKVRGKIRPGGSADVEFEIHVPTPPSGFTTRTFSATATYRGGDGAGTATGVRVQRSGTPLANLQAAYNNVGVTDESDTTKGDFDGDGNSFSAQKLADVGVTPGATVSALGATFVWPDVAAGTKNNATASGQAIEVSGSGSKLAFLGSAAGLSATGIATVYYTDGTTSRGSFGFPNWSFQEPDAHGATLVASSDGRNRPDGYGNAGIAYRIFAHAIPLDAGKTVELVVLPSNSSMHIFDLRIVA